MLVHRTHHVSPLQQEHNLKSELRLAAIPRLCRHCIQQPDPACLISDIPVILYLIRRRTVGTQQISQEYRPPFASCRLCPRLCIACSTAGFPPPHYGRLRPIHSGPLHRSSDAARMAASWRCQPLPAPGSRPLSMGAVTGKLVTTQGKAPDDSVQDDGSNKRRRCERFHRLRLKAATRRPAPRPAAPAGHASACPKPLRASGRPILSAAPAGDFLPRLLRHPLPCLRRPRSAREARHRPCTAASAVGRCRSPALSPPFLLVSPSPCLSFSCLLYSGFCLLSSPRSPQANLPIGKERSCSRCLAIGRRATTPLVK